MNHVLTKRREAMLLAVAYLHCRQILVRRRHDLQLVGILLGHLWALWSGKTAYPRWVAFPDSGDLRVWLLASRSGLRNLERRLG